MLDELITEDFEQTAAKRIDTLIKELSIYLELQNSLLESSKRGET